jgi:hypothetical protein
VQDLLADEQDYAYNVTELNTLLTTLFERYSDLLRRKFSTDFDQVSTPSRWGSNAVPVPG